MNGFVDICSHLRSYLANWKKWHCWTLQTSANPKLRMLPVFDAWLGSEYRGGLNTKYHLPFAILFYTNVHTCSRAELCVCMFFIMLLCTSYRAIAADQERTGCTRCSLGTTGSGDVRRGCKLLKLWPWKFSKATMKETFVAGQSLRTAVRPEQVLSVSDICTC